VVQDEVTASERRLQALLAFIERTNRPTKIAATPPLFGNARAPLIEASPVEPEPINRDQRRGMTEAKYGLHLDCRTRAQEAERDKLIQKAIDAANGALE
jgi:hypothetical protein